MKTTIVFDTETTGLLKPEIVDLDQQPYIIEYYGAKIDKDFNLIDELWFKCKPPIKIEPIITTANRLCKAGINFCNGAGQSSPASAKLKYLSPPTTT